MDLQEFEQRLATSQGSARAPTVDFLFHEAIELLGALEQHLTVIDQNTVRCDWAANHDTGKQMLAEIVEFLLDRIGKERIECHRSEFNEISEAICAYSRLHERGFVAKLFKINSVDPELTRQSRITIGSQFRQIFWGLLIKLGPFLSSPQKRQEWETSCQIFVDEFYRRWYP